MRAPEGASSREGLIGLPSSGAGVGRAARREHREVRGALCQRSDNLAGLLEVEAALREPEHRCVELVDLRGPVVVGDVAQEGRRVGEKVEVEACAALEGVLLEHTHAECMDGRDGGEIEIAERRGRALHMQRSLARMLRRKGDELGVGGRRRAREGVERDAKALPETVA